MESSSSASASSSSSAPAAAALAPAPETEFTPDLVDAAGKNAKAIVCKRCGSSVLSAGVGIHVEREIEMPGDHVSEPAQQLHHFWLMNDMFAFENIGFTRGASASSIRYLTCADCELGVLGRHDPSVTPKEYLLAHSRIQYK